MVGHKLISVFFS